MTKQGTNQVVKGSLADIAQREGAGLAATFVGVTAVVIVDTSGSMSCRDAPEGRTRYEQACIELEHLQAELPGKVAVFSFSDTIEFCPTGRPIDMGYATNMAWALEYTKILDVDGIRFFLISDGLPDSQSAALKVARTYQNRIDTIHVGPESDTRAIEFLNELAGVGRGVRVVTPSAKELGATVQKLLSATA